MRAMHIIRICTFMLPALAILPSRPAAAETAGTALLSAVEIIERLGGKAPPREAPSGEAPAPAAETADEIDVFLRDAPVLEPEDAARRWLELLDGIFTAGESGVFSSTLFEKHLSALPGPESWPHLARILDGWQNAGPRSALRTAAVRIIVFFINGEREKAAAAVSDFEEALGKTAVPAGDDAARHTESLTSFFARPPEDHARAVLDSYQKTLDGFAPTTFSDRSLVVPDLVSLAGEEEAAMLIERTLGTRYAEISVPSGGETAALMARMVLKSPEKMASPPWDLVRSINDVELFEVMRDRFPGEITSFAFLDGYEGRRRAMVVYLVGLAAAGRLDDAAAFASEFFGDMMLNYEFGSLWRRLDHSLFDDNMFRFLDRLLESRPRLELYDEYTFIALVAGREQEMFDRLESLSSREDVTGLLRRKVMARLGEARLAVDDVDGALAAYRMAMADDLAVSGRGKEDFAEMQLEAARTLVQVGSLLSRKKLVEEGVAAASGVLASWRTQSGAMGYGISWELFSLTDDLVEAGHYTEAQELLVSFMKAEAARAGEAVTDLSRPLAQLVHIFSRLERHEDVLLLLEEAPWWGAADLIFLDRDLWPAAAKALHAAGRTPEALKIVRNHLYGSPGGDRAYEVLMEIGGDDTLSWLDGLYRRDRFEERPLIWKARLLLTQGRLEEAEETARLALKVDPTDGEQKAGDRVRAYAVLADILAARGKDDDARFFRDVVESVRVAEEGDRLRTAGLLARSLDRYDRAGEIFADAYCVLWRVAERHYARGEFEEAEKYYRKAFERMPEQFGRVASLCFGCDGVFDRERSRSVAEEVLGHLLQSDSERPQVHFLLGQLREAQSRYGEAWNSYARAIQLDPDYLDAIEKMYEIREHLALSAEELERITFEMLRLDPLGRHAQPSLFRVRDVGRLWQLQSEASQLAVESIDSLLPLPASIDAFREELESPGHHGRFGRRSMAGPAPPGEILSSHLVMQSVAGVLAAAETAPPPGGASDTPVLDFLEYLFR